MRDEPIKPDPKNDPSPAEPSLRIQIDNVRIEKWNDEIYVNDQRAEGTLAEVIARVREALGR